MMAAAASAKSATWAPLSDGTRPGSSTLPSGMILYNLFPLLAGKFTQWDEHFARAAAMGFDWVFVNPIQKPGASRSLYSISDYFQFNPGLHDTRQPTSPEEQVRKAIAQAKDRGLKMMIDLVINHCAIDSPLTREHPKWFVRDHDGHIVNSSCQQEAERVIWKDLAQFDHLNSPDAEGLYQYCRRVVEYLLGLGFEGFRCDAAYQVSPNFWQRLIREIKAREPRAVFSAETLGCTADQTKDTALAGFDFVFNSSKWWNLQDWWLIEQYNLVREAAPSISFPESHDTPRLCAEVNGNVEVLKQRYLFSALFSAGVMMPMGFEFGIRKPLNVVHTTPADWVLDTIDLRPFISRVNTIKRSYAVFLEDSPTSLLPCNNPNILMMWKASTKHKDEALLILNKDCFSHQEFHIEHFRHFVQAGAPLRDVSPEHTLDYLHEPFHYALRPGQGIVLVTTRS
jgi:starch synthase (maltosyl-transferring)